MPDSSDAIQSATAGVSRCTARCAGSDSRARGQRQQRRDGYDRKHDRNIKAAKTNRRADSTGNPEAGGRGGALDRILEAQNGPPTDKPHAGYQTFDNASHRLRSICSHGFRCLDKPATGNSDEREGPKPRTPFRFFPVPADRERQKIGQANCDQVRHDVEMVRPQKLFKHPKIRSILGT